MAAREKLEISIVSESIPHLRKGAMKDFLKIMQATGRFNEDRWNKTFLTYTFANGSYIEFFSVDQEGKVRGPRRDILYINECNNISFETYHQLAIRTRKTIWLDYNPANQFWVHTELENDEDVEFLTLTYKDNEALDEAIVKEIEKGRDKAYKDIEGDIYDKENIKSAYWDNWWKVYGLGLLGVLEGVIFSNWTIINEIPQDARLIGNGLDFGYTNDPTASTDIYTYNGKRILDERIYQTKLMNGDIAKLLPAKTIVYADSAEPKSIAEIKILGIDIRATVKGPDSIKYGIQLMQQQEYLITKRSVNIIKEFRNYCWDRDKEGNTLNKPIDIFNHAIDGIRYHEMMTLSTKQFKYS